MISFVLRLYWLHIIETWLENAKDKSLKELFRSLTNSAASKLLTLTILFEILLKKLEERSKDFFPKPETICGNSCNSWIALPSTVLSGANDKK